MSAHIVNYHSIINRPAVSYALSAVNTEYYLGKVRAVCRTVYISLTRLFKYASLGRVAHYVVKYRNRTNSITRRLYLADIALICLSASVDGIAHRPALTVNYSLRIDSVYRTLNVLHGLNIVESHKVKAQAVKIIFLYPIGGGINHKLTVHISLGCRIVSASARRGVCARRVVSVIVVRNYAVEGAVCVISVVINNIHYNADACLVKRSNHLLIFLYSHLSVIRIGRIASLGNIIILRIVSPVELSLGIALINSCVVIYREQMNVSNSKIFKVIYTNRYTVLVFKSCLGERKIFTLILRGSYLVREVSYVYFPYNSLGIALDIGIKLRRIKSLGVCKRKIDYHRAITVYTRRLSVRVGSLLSTYCRSYGIGIIDSVSARLGVRPYTLITSYHLYRFISVNLMSLFKKIENHL